METFTVYLFVRENARWAAPVASRLEALHKLREELAALGNVRVTAVPDEADLQVEIRNVINPSGEPGHRRGRRPTGHRVLIIRMLIANEPVEFVCADGVGDVPAEQHAARRVLVWLYNLTQYHRRTGSPLLCGVSVN